MSEYYCLIVTYNNRWQFLSRVLERLGENVGLNVVVVNNGSTDFPETQSSVLNFNTYKRIDFTENVGSAKAYGEGLKYIRNVCPDAIVWMIDDDNLPENGAFAILKERLFAEESLHGHQNIMVLALRPSRNYLTRIVAGENIEKVLSYGNDFLGFSFKKLVYKLLPKLNMKIDSSRTNSITLPYAPYGGLMFRSGVIDKIGYPDERFFVYADDFDFTSRLAKIGGEIIIEPRAVVHDLELSWQSTSANTSKLPLALRGSPFRVYYSTRNFIFFQKQRLVKSQLAFAFNALIYILYLSLRAALSGKFAGFAVFLNAVIDGWRGNFDNSKYRP